MSIEQIARQLGEPFPIFGTWGVAGAATVLLVIAMIGLFIWNPGGGQRR